MSADKIIFEDLSAAELSIVPSSLAVLLGLAQHSVLVVVVQSEVEGIEKKVHDCLAAAGVFSAGLKQHRVLFCTTTKGKLAMNRQLEPMLCVDGQPVRCCVHSVTSAYTQPVCAPPHRHSSHSSSPPQTTRR